MHSNVYRPFTWLGNISGQRSSRLRLEQKAKIDAVAKNMIDFWLQPRIDSRPEEDRGSRVVSLGKYRKDVYRTR